MSIAFTIALENHKTNQTAPERSNGMNNSLKSLVNSFTKKPRILFLVDGLGAAVTATSLFFVLRNYAEYFGMPAGILTYLSILGLVYCAYSMACYLYLQSHWAVCFRIIGFSNLVYCLVTIALLYRHYSALTNLGLIYFLGEILIILLLVGIEFRVANMLSKEKHAA